MFDDCCSLFDVRGVLLCCCVVCSLFDVCYLLRFVVSFFPLFVVCVVFVARYSLFVVRCLLL